MKTAERQAARAMRRNEGVSIREIADELRVARSSVSRWVRDIELSERQRLALQARNPIYSRQAAGTAALVAKARERRVIFQDEGRALARAGDPLFIAGCMLYWAEGAKCRNAIRFSNSDPNMVAFFLRFMRTFFAVQDAKVRVSCHLYADHVGRQAEIERFWLDVLGLPVASLLKSTVNAYSRSSQRKRRNMLPYGTCRLVVNDTRVAQMVLGSIQECGGFRRDEWLDS